VPNERSATAQGLGAKGKGAGLSQLDLPLSGDFNAFAALLLWSVLLVDADFFSLDALLGVSHVDADVLFVALLALAISGEGSNMGSVTFPSDARSLV
jgi:hypothetical protein